MLGTLEVLTGDDGAAEGLLGSAYFTNARVRLTIVTATTPLSRVGLQVLGGPFTACKPVSPAVDEKSD